MCAHVYITVNSSWSVHPPMFRVSPACGRSDTGWVPRVPTEKFPLVFSFSALTLGGRGGRQGRAGQEALWSQLSQGLGAGGRAHGEHTQWLKVGGSETGDFNKSH